MAVAIEADPFHGEDGIKDEVRQAVRALWVHFAAAGTFSGLINLLT